MTSDPYKYFRIEAHELLEQLGKGVMDLERERPPSDTVPRLLRLAHTLKGAARVVKQREIGDLAHEIEDRLAPFREGGADVPRENVESVLGLVDAIGTRVGALAPPDTTATAAADEPFRTLRTDVGEMDELLDGIAEAQTCLGALRRNVASIGRARRLANVVGETLTALAGRAGPLPSGDSPAVKAAKDLRSLVDDLERGLASDIERVERELHQVRGAGERLRLSPVSILFASLERAVRDAARSLGKRAAFRGEGGAIRLDGHVLGALQPTLVQIVRNAVAHGIEPDAERIAAGKPAEGSVIVDVHRRGTRVAITCRDDGQGIDLEAVRRALRRKGKLPESGDDADPELVLGLLLQGGISTSTSVTAVSGRGVGLDVVREVMARLGGKATVRTRSGEGTTLEMIVPVSLSSLEALIVEAAGVTAAIPADAVRETVRLDGNAVARSPEGESIVFQGTLIPFRPLAQALRNGALHDTARARSAVVVGGTSGLAAFGVERMLGRASLLVRPVPASVPLDAVVGGLSLDAGGNPQPVLDPERLVETARRAPGVAASPPAPVPPILVVDDSLTTRMLEQSILESAGYVVELASSGEEALEKARRTRYSLFLVDVEMPGMDGYGLLEHLGSHPELSGIPALLVTSRSTAEDRARGIQAGARAYIVKSEFDQVELLETIRRLVG